MTVKEKRGRRRYIAFTVPEEIGKQTLIHRLRECVGDAPYVVQCGRGLAVVRCAPNECVRTMDLMKTAYPSSGSLMTSGTLKALRSKVPGLDALFEEVKSKS